MLTDKNEILKKLGLTLEDIFGPGGWPNDWAAIDADGTPFGFKRIPDAIELKHYGKEPSLPLYHLNKGKPFDMTGIDWTACVFQRPVDESKWVGLLGRFFGSGDDDNRWDEIIGELRAYAPDLAYVYKNQDEVSRGWYREFKPLTVAELDEYKRRALETGIE